MRRLPFRLLLPVAMLLLSSLLMVLSEAERSAMRSQQLSSDGTVGGWDLATDGNMIPTVGEVALFALNAPAFLVAVIPIGFLDPSEQTWVSDLIVSLAILAQWFLVGLAIDRKLATDLPGSEPNPSRSRRVFVWVGLAMSTLIALVSFAVNVLGGSGLSWDLWLGFWFALIAVMLWRRIREWRKPTDDSVTTLQLIR